MKATERRNDESHFDSSDWSEVNVLVSALSKSSCPVKLISKRLHCKLQQPQPTLNNVTKTYHKTVSTIACSHDRNLCNQRNTLNENKQESSKMGTSVQTMHKAKPSKRQYEQMLNIPSCQRRTAFLIQNDIEFTCLSKYNFDDTHIDLVSNSCTRTSSKFTNDLNIKEISELSQACTGVAISFFSNTDLIQYGLFNFHAVATRKRFRMECKERCNAESNERGASLRLQTAL